MKTQLTTESELPLGNSRRSSLRTTALLALSLIAATPACIAQVVGHPELFYLVNVIPNSESGETDQNSEPSLGVGTGGLYGDLIVHSFNSLGRNKYYISTNHGLTWTVAGPLWDNDCTLDWGSAGTLYAGLFSFPTTINVVQCAGLPGNFATIPGGTLTGSLDQPWVRVVSMNRTNPQADHIYVGFNNLANWPGSPLFTMGSSSGKTASVNFSLDGGTTWNASPGSPSQPAIVIENIATKVGFDSPAVRLAAAADGKIVYALFQRYTDYNQVDHPGDVVLVKDNNSGLDSFTDLNSVVASGILIPFHTTLGQEIIQSGCDVAIDPRYPNRVYVAYTELLGNPPTPVVQLQSSANGGSSFNPVYSIINASLPALAVAADGTVGLLLAATTTANFEVRLYKWSNITLAPANRLVAWFPKGDPQKLSWDPYIGDYFTLKAVNYNFYGTFSASGDPDPSHFMSQVFYQRNVLIGTTVVNNCWLSAKGTLVDTNHKPVPYSIDPFFFCDIAPSFVNIPRLKPVPPSIDTGDPLGNIYHLDWPVLPSTLPPFQLQSSPVLGQLANWTYPTDPAIIQNNGEFEAAPDLSLPQRYFRLSQNLAGAQFQFFVTADSSGLISPSGILTNGAMGSQTFTATPMNHYGVAKWYLDGAPVQASSTLTVSNIISEHTLLVTFAPSNDVAVTLTGMAPGPALVTNSFEYDVEVANTGLNTVTGVTMTNTLDPSVSFVSAASTQGTVTHSGNLVTAALGTLSPGTSAKITILVIPNSETTITDTVSVACSQFEPNLANNAATNVTAVVTPVTITSQPQSQSVAVGATASFSVGVAGTPPFAYQWLFNSVGIPGATNSTLTLASVTTSNAGPYAVSVFQLFGPENGLEADSQTATLTVTNSSPPPAIVTLAATSITTTSAVLNATINGEGSQAVGHFQYGTGTNYAGGQVGTYFTSFNGDTEPFSYTLTGLAPNTTYHYRAFGFNCCLEGFGGDTNFTTAWAPLPPAPLSPGTATDTGYTTFDLATVFSWTGFAQASSYDLIISQYPYGVPNIVFTASVGGTSYQIPNGILQTGTKYAWYMVSFNSLGDESANSGSLYFQTPIPPTVQSLAPTNVFFNRATFEGFVNPNGSATTAYFEWGTTTNYGHITTQTGIGTTPQNFSATVSLTNGITYHYRIDAANGVGLSEGLPDIQFTTPFP